MRTGVTRIRGFGKLFCGVGVEGGPPVVTLRYYGVCIVAIITLTLMAPSDWPVIRQVNC